MGAPKFWCPSKLTNRFFVLISRMGFRTMNFSGFPSVYMCFMQNLVILEHCQHDPHPLCCHCTGTCPCSWGAPCRKCPKRTGRHHLCDWCPGDWCRWAPINHPTQMRSPVRKNLPQHLLEAPMTLSDKYRVVALLQYCSILNASI